MKTPFTSPQARVSADTRARWQHIESLVGADIEAGIRHKLRHLVLGCAQCRQEEVACLLVRGYNLLPAEAAAVMELLTEEYRLGVDGKRELQALREDRLPALDHDRDGRPTPGFAGGRTLAPPLPPPGEPPSLHYVDLPGGGVAVQLPFARLPEAACVVLAPTPPQALLEQAVAGVAALCKDAPCRGHDAALFHVHAALRCLREVQKPDLCHE